MNSIKLLKAQANLALTTVDPRAKIAIDNYIAALENAVDNAENLAESRLEWGGEALLQLEAAKKRLLLADTLAQAVKKYLTAPPLANSRHAMGKALKKYEATK